MICTQSSPNSLKVNNFQIKADNPKRKTTHELNELKEKVDDKYDNLEKRLKKAEEEITKEAQKLIDENNQDVDKEYKNLKKDLDEVARKNETCVEPLKEQLEMEYMEAKEASNCTEPIVEDTKMELEKLNKTAIDVKKEVDGLEKQVKDCGNKEDCLKGALDDIKESRASKDLSKIKKKVKDLVEEKQDQLKKCKTVRRFKNKARRVLDEAKDCE